MCTAPRCRGRDGATFKSINSTTGKAFGQFVESSATDVDLAVRVAPAAFEEPWRKLSPTRRGRLMMRWDDLVTAHAEKIATLVEPGVLAGIFAAAGQTCVAGSRAFFQKGIYGQLAPRLVDRAKNIRLGDPLKADTQMGPVATAAQLSKDEKMVARAVSDGARVLTGGERRRVDGFEGGYFYAPTILEGAKEDAFIMQNEVFGPVLCVTPFETEEEVLKLANGTAFGLAAGVWTRDIRRGHLMARRLQAGTVWINTYRALTFNSPFGGFKNSGLGRLNGAEAIQNFLQTKSVWCELSSDVQDPFVMKS
jgi:acyl-CoA reductase-like NAD-dependent aldehyde dehydrogenase